MSWKDEHERIYGDDQERSPEEDRGPTQEEMAKAEALLEEAEKRNIWIYISDEGRAALTYLDTRRGDMVDQGFLETLGRYREAITRMVSDRRRDGNLTHSLVVLLEDFVAYLENGQRRVELDRGQYRVLRQDIAQQLIDLGYAAEWPEPEE